MIIFIIYYQMYYTDFYYISSNGDTEHKVNGVYILGLYWLSKKNSLHIVYEFQSLCWISIVSYKDSKCSEVSHFCLTYNTLIVQINNTICHIFISSLPFLTFFCFSFHLFLGNLSLINHINNIFYLRSLSYNKLVYRDKNGNVILSLTRILGKFNTLKEKKNGLNPLPHPHRGMRLFEERNDY